MRKATFIPFFLTCLLLSFLFYGCYSSYPFLSKAKNDEMHKLYRSASPYFKLVAAHMQVRENDTICDIAGGFGWSISLLYPYMPANVKYFEEDINKKFCNKNAFKAIRKFNDADYNIRQFKFIVGEKREIPYRSNSFNNVVLFISIHEFEYKTEMLNEIARVMRENGRLTILEQVYKDSAVIDPNCGFTYLSDEMLHNLIESSNLHIMYDTAISDKIPLGNLYDRLLVCGRKANIKM